MSNNDWFKKSFSADYLKIYQHRDAGDAQKTIDYFLSQTPIQENAKCLDLCCGTGRHLSYLDSKGLDLYGLDLSIDLLNEVPQSLKHRVIQGDMRSLPWLNESFDAVFSLFTSFGYFSDDAVNQQVIDEVSRILRKDGIYLIDFLDADSVIENIVAEDESEINGILIKQNRRIDTELNMVIKNITMESNGETRNYTEMVKLYKLDDFIRMFNSAGLTIRHSEIYHSRLLMIAEK
ncbi:MAG: class I SAM-dependent methyltransferase [Lentisphaeria bacterium]|nr:class I SAM-dependent methyltransferase [Lentisphaeria bacterium]NQZ71317.1 class I SAM-dependent methyltransferase [Lentisphaeria bacterium]